LALPNTEGTSFFDSILDATDGAAIAAGATTEAAANAADAARSAVRLRDMLVLPGKQ
jgi:hypothetical protein